MRIERPFHDRKSTLDDIYAEQGLQRRQPVEVTGKTLAKFVGGVLIGALLLYLAACIRAL